MSATITVTVLEKVVGDLNRSNAELLTEVENLTQEVVLLRKDYNTPSASEILLEHYMLGVIPAAIILFALWHILKPYFIPDLR